MALISVCIPAYEMHGYGTAFLARALKSLDRQVFRDFDVVVSDHSANAVLARLCQRRRRYPLHYVQCRNEAGNSSVNTNFAVKHANGEIVKILHQDDFLFDKDALYQIARAMYEAPDRLWGGTGCIHVNQRETAFYGPHIPSMTPRLLHGHNRFGAPSVMFVRRKNFLEFDEQLIWLSDCEVYYRMQLTLGEPVILPEPLVAIRQWRRQVTHTAVSEARKLSELRYVLEKHNVPV